MRPRRESALEQLTDLQRQYLATGDARPDGFDSLLWQMRGVEETWRIVGDAFTQEWAALHPGRRPAAWWQFSAPQERIEHLWSAIADDHAAQRRRVGGVGTPSHEVLSVWPRFAFGIPVDWVSEFDELFYNGAARDVHGRAIGAEYKPGHFKGRAPRRDDPPTYEAQASYLDRHGLFLDGEKERAPPAGWEPEVLAIEPDDVPDVRVQFPGAFENRIFDETATQ